MITTTEATIMNQNAYESRVQELEAKGMTRSDAQGVADAEQMESQPKTEVDPMENRFENMGDAELHAANLEKATGKKHHAYLSSYAFAPYVTAQLPDIGDAVSMSFNGDTYPCGTIEKISPTYARITTSEGKMFTRVSANCWKLGGKHGAFSLVQGTIHQLNPEF